MAITVREYVPADAADYRRMRHALWLDDTEQDTASWLARSKAAVFVAQREAGGLCGFAEVGERSIADGCETSPVAYLEGWYVDPDMRRASVGTQLVEAVERWARAHRYQELASDATIDNVVSQQAHHRLGFTETDRCVLYRKVLQT